MARTEIRYTHAEILKLMIDDQDISEGLWQLVVNFGFTAMNAPSAQPKQLTPGALIVVNHLAVQRVEEGAPAIPGITIDAATGELVGTMDALAAARTED